jgi:hypothetical protein
MRPLLSSVGLHGERDAVAGMVWPWQGHGYGRVW